MAGGFGTEDAHHTIAQKAGNGAIVGLLTCGRPLRDVGRRCKSSKGYGAEWDAHGKAPSFPASRIESGSARARIAKERRGSDAEGPDHGPKPVPSAAFVFADNPSSILSSREMKSAQWFFRAFLCAIARNPFPKAEGNAASCVFPMRSAPFPMELGVHPLW